MSMSTKENEMKEKVGIKVKERKAIKCERQKRS